jgi:hypothetical protein
MNHKRYLFIENSLFKTNEEIQIEGIPPVVPLSSKGIQIVTHYEICRSLETP